MVWKPHVTVAAVVERDGRYLVVEEDVRGRRVLNNPAGHLEPGESLVEAVRRETLEETGWEFEPDAVTGIYLWKNAEADATFLRVAFHGRCVRHHPERRLDQGIVAAHWLAREDLAGGRHVLRTPLVLRCIDDLLAGRRYPLDILSFIPDPT
ncbi:MAG TPA: NUDIX hydrolase [Gammaproteobacteria bacterium]|nr:NUDIX hydrolase [Gammaproteobacteria bacterium]